MPVAAEGEGPGCGCLWPLRVRAWAVGVEGSTRWGSKGQRRPVTQGTNTIVIEVSAYSLPQHRG